MSKKGLGVASVEEADVSRESAQMAQILERISEGLRPETPAKSSRAQETLNLLVSQGGALAYPFLRDWLKVAEVPVRRALVRAVAEAADPADPFRAPLLLGLLEPLLRDPDPDVRAQARKALVDVLLPVYPEECLDYLIQWADGGDHVMRGLLKRALAQLPPRLARRALIYLRRLARTGDAKTKRMVLQALESLGRQAPETVAEELRRWADDPELSRLLGESVSPSE